MSLSGSISGEDAVQVLETLSSSLSFFGGSYAIYKIYKGNKQHLLTNQLLVVLLGIDVVLSIFYGVGEGGQTNYGFCQFQGFMVQWLGLAGILWVALMSYYMKQWIVEKVNPDKLSVKIKRHAHLILGATAIMGFGLLGGGVFGDAGVWCWITIDNQWIRFGCFYVFLLLAWIYTIMMLYYVSNTVRGHIETGTEHDFNILQSSEKVIQRRLAMYVFIFIFTWFFGLLKGLVDYLYGQPMLSVTILQAMFLPLRGFLNAACFGNLMKHVREYYHNTCCGGVSRSRRDSIRAIEQPNVDIIAADLTVPHNPKVYVPKQYSIFMTTFNLGEAKMDAIKADMVDWILRGHDIYVIGCQECLDLDGLRKVVWDYIGGPSEFSMFSSEIGSGNTKLGYHGYIAISVYVRNRDIMEGNVLPTVSAAGTLATGTNLIVTTAQNKGGVGIPLQIHDTNIGFVSCHLPSDSKGASKLSKRNASAQSILRELNLAPENIGMDMHMQHDHVVVMGDVNYRMDTQGIGGGVSALTGVSVACLIEKHVLNEDPNWFRRRYNLLRSPTDSLYPSSSERRLMAQARIQARGAWTSVLRADELRMIMEDGDAFTGFVEPLPCFPPSYKRKKGDAGDCGDYCDPLLMIKGYSNTGEVEADMVILKPIENQSEVAEIKKRIRENSRRAIANNDSESDDEADKEENLKSQEQKEVENTTADSSTPENNNENSDANDDNSESNDTDKEVSNSNTTAATGRKRQNRRKNAAMAAEDIPVQQPMKKADAKKIRPPSYTDRILVHSVEDRKHRATIQAYDWCDTMRVSDHRPVSMTLVVEVNAAVRFPDNSIDFSKPRLRENVNVDLYELTIMNLVVVMGDKNKEAESEVDEEPESTVDTDIALTKDVENTASQHNEFAAEKGAWRKKVEQEALSRQQDQSVSGKLKQNFKKQKKKSKKDDKVISQVRVVFPLPTKDPLITHKKVKDIADAFSIDSSQLLSKYKKISDLYMGPQGSAIVTSESVSKKDPTMKTFVDTPLISKDAFLKPASVFPWREQNAFPEGQSTCDMKVSGAVSAELGSHVLLQLTNASGYDLGQCVFAVTPLMLRDRNRAVTGKFKVPLTSGGSRRGEVSVTIGLRYLGDESDLNNTNNNNKRRHSLFSNPMRSSSNSISSQKSEVSRSGETRNPMNANDNKLGNANKV